MNTKVQTLMNFFCVIYTHSTTYCVTEVEGGVLQIKENKTMVMFHCY